LLTRLNRLLPAIADQPSDATINATKICQKEFKKSVSLNFLARVVEHCNEVTDNSERFSEWTKLLGAGFAMVLQDKLTQLNRDDPLVEPIERMFLHFKQLAILGAALPENSQLLKMQEWFLQAIGAIYNLTHFVDIDLILRDPHNIIPQKSDSRNFSRITRINWELQAIFYDKFPDFTIRECYERAYLACIDKISRLGTMTVLDDEKVEGCTTAECQRDRIQLYADFYCMMAHLADKFSKEDLTILSHYLLLKLKSKMANLFGNPTDLEGEASEWRDSVYGILLTAVKQEPNANASDADKDKVITTFFTLPEVWTCETRRLDADEQQVLDEFEAGRIGIQTGGGPIHLSDAALQTYRQYRREKKIRVQQKYGITVGRLF
jgi:hypothetical protein